LPSPAKSVGRAAGLVAEAHVVGVLVVEGYPLRFSLACDVVEGYGAVVAVDACCDDSVAAERGFLVKRVARGGCIFGIVCCAADGCDFAGFDVEVVDVVPFDLEGFLSFVDFDGEPDVARFPKRDGVPLVAEVEVRRFLGAVDAHGEAGLGVEGASVQGGDDEGLGPGTRELVRAEGNYVCRRLEIIECFGKRERTVWPVTRLVAHQRKVALVSLNDRWCLEIVLVESMNDLVKSSDILVV
jgi:hypothetical protein